MSECLLYYVKEGSTKSVDISFLNSFIESYNHHVLHQLVANTVLFCLSRVGQNGDIQLSGQFIMEEHCTFDNKGGMHIYMCIHVHTAHVY